MFDIYETYVFNKTSSVLLKIWICKVFHICSMYLRDMGTENKQSSKMLGRLFLSCEALC